jgi:hypothetical protein
LWSVAFGSRSATLSSETSASFFSIAKTVAAPDFAFAGLQPASSKSFWT